MIFKIKYNKIKWKKEFINNKTVALNQTNLSICRFLNDRNLKKKQILLISIYYKWKFTVDDDLLIAVRRFA